MKFSYSAVWEDTARLIRAHGPLIAAIAGVFIFLPALLLGYFLPPPQSGTADAAENMRVTLQYYSTAWPWFLLQNLLAMTGMLAVLRLIFARGTTVGAALTAAAALLPFYFLVSVISGILVGIGLVLLILPGAYLFGRLAVAGPVMVAETRRNPFEAMSRSFEVTKGHGWAIVGMVLLVIIAGGVIIIVADALLGILLVTVAGPNLGRLLAQIVSSAAITGFTLVMAVLYAAIYRALTGNATSTAAVFD
ncbi:MAG: hypothetical protein JWO25_2106 [Alphaproteobacteria bacterium]|nr:hypothetical protein [Alphaproteobacteria bacterium]MDB5722773.1 hypothetical protein [Alphaproteobacteria bacterium]